MPVGLTKFSTHEKSNNLSGVNRLGEANCPSGIVRFRGGMPSVDSGQFD
jgi:hypothetical protein